MRWFCATALFNALVTVGFSAEIVAWKVPITAYAKEGLQTKGAARISKSPEESPLLQATDELYDLGDVAAIDPKVNAEWIIWNATSGRIVMKGGWTAIRQMHGYLKAADGWTQVGFTFDFHDVAADGSAPKDKAAPAFSRSAVIPRDRIVPPLEDENDVPLSLSGYVGFGELLRDIKSYPLVEWTGSISATLNDGQRVGVTSSVILKAGEPLWLARSSDEKSGIDIKVTATPQLADGTPWKEMLLWQKDSGVESLVLGPGIIPKTRVGEGWFVAHSMDRYSLDRFLGISQPYDPFVELPKEKPVPPELPGIDPPAILAKWIDYPIRDLSARTKELGLTPAEGDLVAYDPFQNLLFCYARNELLLDNIELLMDGGCRMPADHFEVTMEGRSSQRLVIVGGRRGIIERVSGDWKVVRTLGIETSHGQGDPIKIDPSVEDEAVGLNETADLTLNWWVERKPEPEQSLKTMVQLENGKLSGVLRDGTDPAREFPWRVKVEIVNPYP